MADADDKGRPRAARLPRFRDLVDVSDEMIAFVEKYQQVWASESKAMISLGEFLGARAQSLQSQVELMRMGSDAFRRYTAWSDALMDMRPDRFMRAWLSEMEQRTRPARAESDTGDEPT
jgi:hypothetical protein